MRNKNAQDLAQELVEDIEKLREKIATYRNAIMNPDEQTIEFCGRIMATTKQLKEDADEFASEAGELYRMYQQVIMPRRMRELGEEVTKFNVKGLGTFSLVPDFHISIISSKKEDAKLWLVEEGMGDLIVETVNASSLKAAIKRRMERLSKENESGDEPKDILPPSDKFRCHMFEYVKLTKK